MLEPWRTGRITRIEYATHNTKRFWIEIPELSSFPFRPGQFVTLDLPIHEQKNKRWRSYSIASRPDGSNTIELLIVLQEGGAGTAYLFHDVTLGDTVQLRGPQGVFTLPDPLDKDVFLICTGTGVAPFRSMALHLFHENIPHRNIYLVYGCRRKADLLYAAEMQELTSGMDGFHYLPVFSREAAVNDLRTGYVHAIYESILSEEKRDALFYLCGWKNMVDEAKARLLAMGYDKKVIHQELYG
ncbi:MAG: ferredoxin--NADP reductase [Chitinophagaceae bacterium]